jgi:CRISPR-associated endonuclease/helicase Cas3
MLHELYAHSLPQRPPDEWQLLDRHLAAVAKLADQFACAFQSADWAWNAGWLHDLGKAAPEFQNYLRKQNGLDDPQYDESGLGRINHSSAGAAWAERELRGFAGRSLAYLSAGHHAGLTDYESDSVAGKGALKFRLDQEGAPLLTALPEAAAEVAARLRPLTKLPKFLSSDRDGKGFHLWLRMLFSCLTDADFLDTEEFMNPGQAAIRAKYPDLAELQPLLDRHMEELATKADKTPVNAIRQEVLAASRAAAPEAPGLFSMNVPTGGGKTLAAMAFALDHAHQHEKNRIIYVIPYTSIIEQTANVLAGIFGRENVVEHHSNLDPDKLDANEVRRASLAAENWDAPVIVTTNVQFFESLYAARPSRCRKLHNLVNSVVILDEAQLLPPNWLVPCVDVINRLTSDYGVTFVLSTATQPSPPGLAPAREIVSDVGRLHANLKRVEIKMPPDLEARVTWESLASELAERKQVLCVVNARRDCRELYDALLTRVPEAQRDSVIHLSALMCGEHRTQVIKNIKQRLKDGLPARVVSTQLVEAGVDLDFPVVYRALAGLDSIAQAAGRCNREGKLTDAQGQPILGEVIVFVPPKDPPQGLLFKAANTTRELAMPGFDPQNPEAYGRYFGLFYCKQNNDGKNWLHEKLVKDVRIAGGPQLQFRTAAEEFKLIDDKYQQPVIVRYGEKSEELIDSLRVVGPKREIMRRLQRYTVNLPRQAVAAMIADGKLEMLENGIVVQTMPGIYKEEVGLDIFEAQMPIDDLMQ